jgi:hypothetical protein
MDGLAPSLYTVWSAHDLAELGFINIRPWNLNLWVKKNKVFFYPTRRRAKYMYQIHFSVTVVDQDSGLIQFDFSKIKRALTLLWLCSVCLDGKETKLRFDFDYIVCASTGRKRSCALTLIILCVLRREGNEASEHTSDQCLHTWWLFLGERKNIIKN